MKNRFNIWVFVFFACCLLPTLYCFSQPTTDEQLATQYLQNKEYDKAVIYFEKLFSKKDGAIFYNPYLLCLIKIEQFDKAEKLIKKMIKQNPQNPRYIVDLGTFYSDRKKTSDAQSQYEKAIKQLTPNQQQVFDLANAFIEVREWDYAIETYRRGKKLLGGFYPFSAEIAGVYEKKGDVTGMVNEYLSLLEYGDDQLQTVQNGLQPSFGEDKDENKNEIIKTELLKKVQANPEKIVYTELLIWFFIQEKNFNGAFVQSKALDKRLHEDGQRLMAIGQLCVSNEDYETASKCFQYVIEKGKDNYNYINGCAEIFFKFK